MANGNDERQAERRPFERYLGFGAVILVLYGCLVVLRPFITALLWGGVMVYVTWPLFDKLNRLLGGRRTTAAAVMTLLITAVFVLPFVIVGVSLAENIDTAKEAITSLQASRLPRHPAWLERLPGIGAYAVEFWDDLLGDTKTFLVYLKQFALSSYSWFFQRLLDIGQGILQLTLSVLASFFFYRDSERLARFITEGVRKIAGDRAQRLLNAVGGTIRSVVYGIIGTALCQGVLAGFGFLVAGVPSPFFLGLLSFFLSPLPIGPPAIWIPAGIWLIYQGHVGWGVFLLLWGTCVVSSVDNFLKPYLISRSSNMSFLLILLGIVGGVIGFGFIGIFLGPTLLAVGYTLLSEYCDHDLTPQAAVAETKRK